MAENRCYDADCIDRICFNPKHYNYICFDPECEDVHCEYLAILPSFWYLTILCALNILNWFETVV